MSSFTIPIDNRHCFTQRFSPTGFILNASDLQLLSPNRSALAFRLKPIRSVQSQAENLVFPLDEYLSPSVVNFTFSLTTVRVIHNRTMCAMKKAGVLSILFVVVLLAVAVLAEAQQPKKVPRIGYLARCSCSTDLGPHRGIPARSARAWLHRGENIVIEYRYAEGKLDRLPGLRPSCASQG